MMSSALKMCEPEAKPEVKPEAKPEATPAKPHKVVDLSGEKYGVVVCSFEDLINKAKKKLKITSTEIRVFLQSDGTQVDAEYFSTFKREKCFLILKDDEQFQKKEPNLLERIAALEKSSRTQQKKIEEQKSSMEELQ